MQRNMFSQILCKFHTGNLTVNRNNYVTYYATKRHIIFHCIKRCLKIFLKSEYFVDMWVHDI